MVGNNISIIHIACQGPYFVAVTEGGVLVVAYTDSCEEARRIETNMYWTNIIPSVAASKNSSLMAIAGFGIIQVWNLDTGEQVVSLSMLPDGNALALAFTDQDEHLLVASDDLSG